MGLGGDSRCGSRAAAAALLAAAAVSLLLPSFAHAGEAPASDSVPAVGGNSIVVEVHSNYFSPSEVHVAPGDVVVWKIVDGGHTVTAAGERFDFYLNRYLKAGETVGYKTMVNETIRYFCRPHGDPQGSGMSGVIVVGSGQTSSNLPSPA
jgi:plastocyanin